MTAPGAPSVTPAGTTRMPESSVGAWDSWTVWRSRCCQSVCLFVCLSVGGVRGGVGGGEWSRGMGLP